MLGMVIRAGDHDGISAAGYKLHCQSKVWQELSKESHQMITSQFYIQQRYNPNLAMQY